MQAGKLKHKIIFEEPINTTDAGGGITRTWDEKMTVWAEVEPLRGERLFYAQQRDAGTDTQIRMRYSAKQIKPQYRIKHNGTIYEIKSIIDTKSAGREIIINARALESEALNGVIAAPHIDSPADNSIISLQPLFTVSDFEMKTGTDTHARTRFQFTTADDVLFNNVLIDTTTTGPGTEAPSLNFEITDTIIEPAGEYIARARHYGTLYGASDWGAVSNYIGGEK